MEKSIFEEVNNEAHKLDGVSNTSFFSIYRVDDRDWANLSHTMRSTNFNLIVEGILVITRLIGVPRSRSFELEHDL